MGWWGAGIFFGKECMQSSEHNWLISQRQMSHNISFLQVGLLDVVRSEDPDKSHNFTNLIFLWRPTLVLYIRGYSIPVSELLFTCLSQHFSLVEWLWDNGRRAKTQRVGRLYLVSKKTKRPNRYFIIVRRLFPYLIDRRLKKKRKGSKQINRKKSAWKEHLRNKVNASFRNTSRVG